MLNRPTFGGHIRDAGGFLLIVVERKEFFGIPFLLLFIIFAIMKHFVTLLSILGLIMSCDGGLNTSEEEGEVKNNPNELTVTGKATDISYETATISAYANLTIELGLASYGLVYSDNPSPSNENGILVSAKVLDENNMYSVELKGLVSDTKYYYVSFIKNGQVYQYGKVRSFKTLKFPDIPQGAVDMGLSVKWASCNLGAAKPYEYGDYYAWGETETKTSLYKWDYYKFGKSESGPFSKYNTNTSYGYVDNKTVLDPEDDAAHVILGGKWRMPTDSEFKELMDNSTSVCVTTFHGTTGILVTSKKNGNTIFFPAAGYKYEKGFILTENGYGTGGYWSSSLDTDNPSMAWWYFGDDFLPCHRYFGQSVRPVLEY